MHVLLAFDKFKGSLTAAEACEAAARGVKHAFPEASLVRHPVADGGEGTVDAMAISLPQARRVEVHVWNAIRSRKVAAPILLMTEGKDVTAFIEMASASGLVLLGGAERDPLKATTFGTGELIRHGVDLGASRIVIGLGGSATNDGGVGFAQALGFRFLDAQGMELDPLPERLADLARVVFPDTRPEVEVLVLCDVQNPLLGPDGATQVYGPQKGVSEDMAVVLEAGLTQLAKVVEREGKRRFSEVRGAGAAGGCAWGLMSFLGGELRPGFDFIAAITGLREAIDAADVVMTGEGRLDAQTLQGKAPMGVAAMARSAGRPVVAIGGSVDPEARSALEEVFDEVISLVGDDVTEARAMSEAATVLEERCFALQGVLAKL